MTQPDHTPDGTEPDDTPDTWSPRTMRIALVILAAGLVTCAFLLSSIFNWMWWLDMAVAVILLCASITPPFRRPRP